MPPMDLQQRDNLTIADRFQLAPEHKVCSSSGKWTANKTPKHEN